MVKATYSIDEKGDISNVVVTQGVDPSLDKEVVRLLKSIPNDIALAKENGKANPKVEFSASFYLQNEDSAPIGKDQSDVVIVGYASKK